jgi:chaperone required for assembly of F1-ATPase
VRKRFYETAEAAPFESQFAVALDGKPVFTPAKSRLQLPTRAAAEAVAAEWQAQGAEIDPTTMPLTRILNAALDGVAKNKEAVAAEIVQYAGSDLVCYRAEGPESLVAAQAEAWDPILAFAAATMGARFHCIEGIVHMAQPPAALEAVAAAVARITDIGAGSVLALACLNVMTTLTGSALIPLAHVGGLLSLDEAWGAAHVDEDFQTRLWGTDAEALARRAQRFAEMAAADRLWQLVQP